MEQMRPALTSKRMSGHGVVLSSGIFHTMILMRIYGAVITFVALNARYEYLLRVLKSVHSCSDVPILLLIDL